MNETNEFNRFFLSKSLASTYKPTFLKCLLDLADYSENEGSQWVKQTNDSLEVDLNFVAARFIRYYWPLRFKFKLKQEATPTPIAMYRLLDEYVQLFEKNKSQPSKRELCSDKFSGLRLRAIREGIKPQVLRKLLNDCKIYSVTKGSNSIIIKKSTVNFMKDHKKILEYALNHVLLIFLLVPLVLGDMFLPCKLECLDAKMKCNLHDQHVHVLKEQHLCGFRPAMTIKSSRYTPVISGTKPIVRKSTIPFAVLGFRYSSKNLLRLPNPLPKSKKTLVPLSSKRILLPPISFTPP